MTSSTRIVRDHVLSRWTLVTAILLVVVIVVIEAARFPGIFTPRSVAVFYLGTLLVTLIAYIAMAMFATRPASPVADVALYAALRWGGVVGTLWCLEVLEANVWRLPGPRLVLLYFGPAIAACVVPGIAAALTARRTRRFRAGLAARGSVSIHATTCDANRSDLEFDEQDRRDFL